MNGIKKGKKKHQLFYHNSCAGCWSEEVWCSSMWGVWYGIFYSWWWSATLQISYKPLECFEIHGKSSGVCSCMKLYLFKIFSDCFILLSNCVYGLRFQNCSFSYPAYIDVAGIISYWKNIAVWGILCTLCFSSSDRLSKWLILSYCDQTFSICMSVSCFKQHLL